MVGKNPITAVDNPSGYVSPVVVAAGGTQLLNVPVQVGSLPHSDPTILQSKMEANATPPTAPGPSWRNRIPFKWTAFGIGAIQSGRM